MWISAKVVSIKLSDTSNSGDSKAPASRNQMISLALAAERHDRLELETGEVFTRFVRTRSKTAELRIAFSLEVYTSANSADAAYSKIKYYPARKGEDPSDAFISAVYYLDPVAFSDVMQNIRAKIYPTNVNMGIDWHVGEPEGPMNFGHAPDGSEIIWKNAQKGRDVVALKSLQFYSQPVFPTKDELEVAALESFDVSPDEPRTASPERNVAITKALSLAKFLRFLILRAV
jgi:hypothetical protein